jgi:hypothetical protein
VIVFHEFREALAWDPAEFGAGNAKALQPTGIEATDDCLLAYPADLSGLPGGKQILHSSSFLFSQLLLTKGLSNLPSQPSLTVGFEIVNNKKDCTAIFNYTILNIISLYVNFDDIW